MANNAPRGGHEQVGGISWMARMIDKARLEAAGEIEPYDLDFPCPMDQDLLSRLGIDAKTFQKIAVDSPNDQAILDALKAQGVQV